MGYYHCPNCYSTDIYKTEEVRGAIGIVLDNPGPVDTGMAQVVKSTVRRCSNCETEAVYLESADEIAARQGRENSATVFSGLVILAVSFLGLTMIGTSLGALPVVTFVFFGFVGTALLVSTANFNRK